MKKIKDIKAFLRKNRTMLPDEVARKTGYSSGHITKLRREMGFRPFVGHAKTVASLPPKKQVKLDDLTSGLREDKKNTNTKYQQALKEIKRLRRERDAVLSSQVVTTTKIKVNKMAESESTAVVLCSDWHSEERVELDVMSGLNEFTLEIATARSELFFQNIQKLIEAKQFHVNIDTLVLALLGDFISGSIHEELVEGNQLQPIEALIFAQNLLASGIQFLLDNTNVKLVIPCHSGNHGRSTQKQRIATERGNSFEYYMYHTLSNLFADEKRVEFRVSKGYFSYMDIAGFKIRFHHGHHLRYGGGVGGLFIPVRKSIMQWNKGIAVDLDCFGHFHQFKWGGDFICNGSLIGYNPYALSIKADFAPPTQAFFLVNHKHKEISDLSPIWLV